MQDFRNKLNSKSNPVNTYDKDNLEEIPQITHDFRNKFDPKVNLVDKDDKDNIGYITKIAQDDIDMLIINGYLSNSRIYPSNPINHTDSFTLGLSHRFQFSVSEIAKLRPLIKNISENWTGWDTLSKTSSKTINKKRKYNLVLLSKLLLFYCNKMNWMLEMSLSKLCKINYVTDPLSKSSRTHLYFSSKDEVRIKSNLMDLNSSSKLTRKEASRLLNDLVKLKLISKETIQCKPRPVLCIRIKEEMLTGPCGSEKFKAEQLKNNIWEQHIKYIELSKQKFIRQQLELGWPLKQEELHQIYFDDINYFHHLRQRLINQKNYLIKQVEQELSNDKDETTLSHGDLASFKHEVCWIANILKIPLYSPIPLKFRDGRPYTFEKNYWDESKFKKNNY